MPPQLLAFAEGFFWRNRGGIMDNTTFQKHYMKNTAGSHCRTKFSLSK